jgi:uncharacterized protein involved in exopolysaccharide biosynthesis
VKIGRENLDPPAVSRNLPLTAGLRHEEVMSEIEILKAPDLIASAVDDIGIDVFKPRPIRATTFTGKVKATVKQVARAFKEQYHEALIALDLQKRLDDRQKAIAGLAESLTVEPVKDSDVISVRLRMSDPTLARVVEDKLIKIYLARRIEVRRTPGVQEFLEALVRERQRKLVSAEVQKDEWKRKSGITSLPEQESLLLKQFRELSASEANTAGEMSALAKQIETSQQLLVSTPEYQHSVEQQTPNPAKQSVEEKLIALKLQRSQGLQKYTPESGVIIALDQSIRRLNELLRQEKPMQVGSLTLQINPNRMAVEQKLHQDTVRLEGLRAMHKKQQDDLIGLSAELVTLNSAEAKWTDIERNRRVAEEDYNTAAKRKFDSDISSQLDKDRVSNVSLAHGPSASVEPVYPRKLLVMAISFAVSITLGVGLALLLNYFDDRVIGPDQVEVATQIPHLGTLHGSQPA